MNEFQKKIIEKYYFCPSGGFNKGITLLSRDLGINESKLGEVVEVWLQDTLIDKDYVLVEYLLALAEAIEVSTEGYVNTLNILLTQGWHYQHENIAFALERLKSPTSINPLFEAAFAQHPYLGYDEDYALAIKCIWGLGRIGTVEASSKLEALAKSNNPIVRDNAVKQLNKIR